jgi:transposase
LLNDRLPTQHVALRLALRSVDAGRSSGRGERRRRWSRDDKMRIIEETLAPGAVVTEIARRHGIATSLVFTWRRRARRATVASAGPRLVPVQVATAESVQSIEAPAAMPARKRRGLIEIELGDGKRVSVDENVDAEALGRVLDVLSRR